MGAATLSGLVTANSDTVNGTVTIHDAANALVTLATTTHAGNYAEKVSSLTGTNALDYSVAETGNTDGLLTVNPKALTATVNSISNLSLIHI